jgi:putative transposase
LVGKAKTLTIKRTPTGKWFAVFSCEIEDRPAKHAHPEREIGLDVGLESFATLSDGTKIGNPRFLVASEKRLAILQRRFSKKTRRSANRESARLKVARLHEKIANQRHDFLHKLSRFLVNRYGKIAIEDLNISNMVRHPYLAKSINDASWGTFARFLAYKAEEAGCEVVKVNPRGTSQNCSQCGIKVPKTLAQRWHLCPNCGLHLDRDINASRNILKTSIRGIRKSQARGEGSSILGEILEFSPSAKREAPQLVGG